MWLEIFYPRVLWAEMGNRLLFGHWEITQNSLGLFWVKVKGCLDLLLGAKAYGIVSPIEHGRNV